MEVGVPLSSQWSTCLSVNRVGINSNHSPRFNPKCTEKRGQNQLMISCHIQPRNVRNQRQQAVLKVLCSSQDFQVPVLEVGPATVDEDLTLKKKSEEVEPLLDGRCIYLVGMMGSGKTTVGKILSGTLGYSFYDCDKLIEQAVGGTTVADIFKVYGETFFRDNETETLRKIASLHRLVVSTGGGAVIRPINWKHMHRGISVWLDVPIEALARRISKEGTNSRPLLHDETGDAYERALSRLSTLWKERGVFYTNASAQVSLENIAVKWGYQDVCNISPTLIAIEALVQIENFLKK